MNIEEYISFIYKGEEPLWEQQYVTEHEREYYAASPGKLQLELWGYYYKGSFGEERPSRKRRFLDSLYNAYPDDKDDFINFVKKSVNQIPDEVLDLYIRMYLEEVFKQEVREWQERLVTQKTSQEGGSQPARERIKPGLLTLEQIRDHLMKGLTAKSMYTNEPIMTEAQVEHLIKANVEDGEEPVDVKKIKSNGDAKEVQAVLYDFYALNEVPYAPIGMYCAMALDNFMDFNGITSIDAFKKNFSRHSNVKRR
ncbi:hypothetical protein [Pontibacter harenae]|uniref:hypothetical protein n=1 Tax=Pontibacter harenae TaxID=2894083 RepID=UPI001E459C43|nr:hypothetical protein [Pontibacter harenae]MCC9168633.1 hypothetical protein [Pontibacter harenae]